MGAANHHPLTSGDKQNSDERCVRSLLVRSTDLSRCSRQACHSSNVAPQMTKRKPVKYGGITVMTFKARKTEPQSSHNETSAAAKRLLAFNRVAIVRYDDSSSKPFRFNEIFELASG